LAICNLLPRSLRAIAEYDSFDIVAACMFSITGRWAFKFKWGRDLTPWSADPSRIGAIQRIDTTWADSLAEPVA
jgi:hypothetical protein